MQRPHLTAVARDFLRTPPLAGATLDDVLAAVLALSNRLERIEAAVVPAPSALLLDQDEIARTMALLRVARPVAKETLP
jgi:hypothetical protein